MPRGIKIILTAAVAGAPVIRDEFGAAVKALRAGDDRDRIPIAVPDKIPNKGPCVVINDLLLPDGAQSIHIGGTGYIDGVSKGPVLITNVRHIELDGGEIVQITRIDNQPNRLTLETITLE